mmetsp:Transcript_1181/g.3594  ORF Transcript_1181/g.3594 Transcript_1181/m.3594 type:complete len:286 (+) Transcript_1181:3210-4067(+)
MPLSALDRVRPLLLGVFLLGVVSDAAEVEVDPPERGTLLLGDGERMVASPPFRRRRELSAPAPSGSKLWRWLVRLRRGRPELLGVAASGLNDELLLALSSLCVAPFSVGGRLASASSEAEPAVSVVGCAASPLEVLDEGAESLSLCSAAYETAGMAEAARGRCALPLALRLFLVSWLASSTVANTAGSMPVSCFLTRELGRSVRGAGEPAALVEARWSRLGLWCRRSVCARSCLPFSLCARFVHSFSLSLNVGMPTLRLVRDGDGGSLLSSCSSLRTMSAVFSSL